METISIQYCSDLHLEFPENEKFLIDNPIIPKAKILLLAGDIVPFKVLDNYNWFWDKLSQDFEQVYWVPGNHEYYHNNISGYKGNLNKNIRDNINLVNNCATVYENVNLVFTTLWSHIKPENQWTIERGLNDFRLIEDGDKIFTAESYNQLHKQSLDFITAEFQKGYKTVICSHHVPTFMNYPEIYKGSALNNAFATELFPLIEEQAPAAWIFGHHHYNCASFSIGNTKMLTNQLGYVSYNEHKQFSTASVVEI